MGYTTLVLSPSKWEKPILFFLSAYPYTVRTIKLITFPWLIKATVRQIPTNFGHQSSLHSQYNAQTDDRKKLANWQRLLRAQYRWGRKAQHTPTSRKKIQV